MRNLLMALVVPSLLVAPSLAVINVQMVADKTSLQNGQSATISIQMQCTSNKAVGALGGNIVASADGANPLGSLTTNNDFAWTSQFTAALNSAAGTPAANGGMSSFGSQQAIPNDTALGKGVWATVASYSVTAGATKGHIVLTLTPASVSGFGPAKSVFAGSFDSTLGTSTPLTIRVVAGAAELLAMGNAWGKSVGSPGYDAASDLNGDGRVDAFDLLILAGNWGG